MTAVKRLTGYILTVALMFLALAPMATALTQQTPIGATSDVGFDATGLPNGATYDLTVGGSVYHVTAQTGNDVILQITPGTVSVAWSPFAYHGNSTRFAFQPADPAVTSLTVVGDMQVTAAFGSAQYAVTFDQTGLPDGTAYFVDWGWVAAVHPMVAGVPLIEWVPGGPYIFVDFPSQVSSSLGTYQFGGLNVPPAQDYFVNGPLTFIAHYISGNIVGTVFLDLNGNSVWDAGEPGVLGATVELLGSPEPPQQQKAAASLPAGLTTLLTTTSDANGNYAFNNLPAGTFYVRATLPDGSQQESGAITLTVFDGTMNNGQADFPEAVKALPYTGR